MGFLVDTSVLVRVANSADPFYGTATRALQELHRRGELLYIAPQNLIEFRNVATRPKAVNGLGLSTSDAELKAAAFEAAMPLLVESPSIFAIWKSLVSSLGVVGKQVHDARLVAICLAHQKTHLLTFNVAHFSRMANFGSGITIVDPGAV